MKEQDIITAATAAHVAATTVYSALSDKPTEGEGTSVRAFYWYCDNAQPAAMIAAGDKRDDMADVTALTKDMQILPAIPETVARHAQGLGMHDFAIAPWDKVPARVRIAYAVFAHTALLVMGELAKHNMQAASDLAMAQMVRLDGDMAEKIGKDDQPGLYDQDPHRKAALTAPNKTARTKKTPEEKAADKAAKAAAKEAGDAKLQVAVMIVEAALGITLDAAQKTAIADMLKAQPEADLHALEDKSTAAKLLGIDVPAPKLAETENEEIQNRLDAFEKQYQRKPNGNELMSIADQVAADFSAVAKAAGGGGGKLLSLMQA